MRPCGGKDLPVTKLRTLCICAFSHHHILSSHMGSEGLSTATQYVLKKRSDMFRNDTLYICHTLLYKK